MVTASLADKLKSLVGTYGPPGCIAVKGILRWMCVPPDLGEILTDLCDWATGKGPDPQAQVGKADIDKLGAMIEVLGSDLKMALDVAVPLAHMPDTMNAVLDNLAAQNRELQAGTARFVEIAQGLEALQQGQRAILEQQGMIRDAQDEQLALQLQGLREGAAFHGEVRASFQALPQAVAQALFAQFRTALSELLAGSFEEAREGLQAMLREHPGLTAPRVVLAAAHAGGADWAGAESLLADASRRRPQDRQLRHLHDRVTNYTTRRLGSPGATGAEQKVPQIGDTLAGYRLEQRLGQGGAGQVFKAVRGGETFALKVMHRELSRNPVLEQGFKEEIGNLFRIAGTPNLVGIRSFDKDDAFGCWCLIMAYIEGRSLQSRLEQQGALPEAEVARIGLLLAQALAVAHRQGVIHADIKPANIILQADGTPVLVDFGSARNLSLGASPSGPNSLTARFAAPEQLRRGEVGPASDVFSLAATLYHALLYDRPDDRDPDEYDPGHVPEDWRGFFDRGLARRPGSRFGSMEDLAAGLEDIGQPARQQGMTAATPEQPFDGPLPGLRMLWVPPGSFRMGSDDGNANEKPVHRVELSGFWLSETPVTNAQYQAFVRAKGHRQPQYQNDNRYNGDRQPVVGVDWDDAQAFCRWLGERDPEHAYRLPTEAQWEYAARGPESRPYPWGSTEPNAELACFGRDWQKDKPDEVGRHPKGQGPFGHQDLAGLVWEWCEDPWDENAYQARSQGARDPVAAGGCARRCLRGGAWVRRRRGPALACRNGDDAGHRHVNIGFRVAAARASRGRL